MIRYNDENKGIIGVRTLKRTSSFVEKSNQWDFTNANTIHLSVQSILPHDNTCFANQYSI